MKDYIEERVLEAGALHHQYQCDGPDGGEEISGFKIYGAQGHYGAAS